MANCFIQNNDFEIFLCVDITPRKYLQFVHSNQVTKPKVRDKLSKTRNHDCIVRSCEGYLDIIFNPSVSLIFCSGNNGNQSRLFKKYVN